LEEKPEQKSVEIKFDFKHPEKIGLILAILIFLVMNWWVMFSSNIIFGDEAYHTHESRWIAQNLEIPKYVPLYGTDLHRLADTKYISSHIFFASLFYVFGFSEFLVKLFVPLLTLFSSIVIYRFVKNYISQKLAFVSIFIFHSFPTLATYSVLYYSDIFLLFFISLSIYFFHDYLKKGSVKYLILTGVFTGFAILSKMSGFILIFLYLIWLVWKKDVKLVKGLVIISLFATIISVPWFIRNFSFFDTPGCGFPIFPSQKCSEGPAENIQLERTPSAVGSEAGIMRMGLLNYVDFAYSINLFLIFLMGLIYVILKKEEIDKFVLAIFLSLFVLLIWFASDVATYRAEDFARQMLPAVIPLGVISFVFVNSFYEFLTKYHKVFGIIFIIIILYATVTTAKSKADTMIIVKQFSPGFFEGARWIRENTEKDDMILSLWTHQTVYTTERKSFWPQSQYVSIFTKNDQTAVDTLKANGFDYIFVQKWSITDGQFYQGYPLAFINFLNSNNQSFSKPFENQDVIIYKVV